MALKMTDVPKRLGERICMLRVERRLTQKELSSRMGISQVYISHLERGTKSASLETLVRVAQSLDVSMSELFLDVDRETPKELVRLSAATAGQPIGIQRRIFRVVEEMLSVVRELQH